MAKNSIGKSNGVAKNFASGIQKLLLRVHPNLTLASEAQRMLLTMLQGVCKTLVEKAKESHTIEAKTIMKIVSTKFPRLLAEHANAEAERQVMQYSTGFLRFEVPEFKTELVVKKKPPSKGVKSARKPPATKIRQKLPAVRKKRMKSMEGPKGMAPGKKISKPSKKAPLAIKTRKKSVVKKKRKPAKKERRPALRVTKKKSVRARKKTRPKERVPLKAKKLAPIRRKPKSKARPVERRRKRKVMPMKKKVITRRKVAKPSGVVKRRKYMKRKSVKPPYRGRIDKARPRRKVRRRISRKKRVERMAPKPKEKVPAKAKLPEKPLGKKRSKKPKRKVREPLTKVIKQWVQKKIFGTKEKPRAPPSRRAVRKKVPRKKELEKKFHAPPSRRRVRKQVPRKKKLEEKPHAPPSRRKARKKVSGKKEHKRKARGPPSRRRISGRRVPRAVKQPLESTKPKEVPRLKVRRKALRPKISTVAPKRLVTRKKSIKKQLKPRKRLRKVSAVPAETKDTPNFTNEIEKIKKMVHPSLDISKEACSLINQLMQDVFERISAVPEGAPEINAEIISTNVTSEFPSSLAEYANSEGHKELMNYSSGLLKFQKSIVAKKQERKPVKRPKEEKAAVPEEVVTPVETRGRRKRRPVSEGHKPKVTTRRTKKPKKVTRAKTVGKPVAKPRVKSRGKEEVAKETPSEAEAQKEGITETEAVKRKRPAAKVSPAKKRTEARKVTKKRRRSQKGPVSRAKKRKVSSEMEKKRMVKRKKRTGISAGKRAGTKRKRTTGKKVSGAPKRKLSRVPSKPPKVPSVNFKEALSSLITYFHPNLSLSNESANFISDFLLAVCQRVVDQAAGIAKTNFIKVLSSMEIHTAVIQVLPEILAEHAISEGSKAVLKSTM